MVNLKCLMLMQKLPRYALTDDRIYIPEKGEVIELKNDRIQPAGRVPAGNVLIDGSGVGDVGNIVLDRKLLSQDGILICGCYIKSN